MPVMRATGAGAVRGGAEASGFGVSNVAEGLSAIQLQRPRIDPRQHALALPVQALVDALAEDHPVVAEDADQNDSAQKEKHPDDEPQLSRDA